MAVITSGKIFSNGEQLTADKMNQMFTSASFDTVGAVDASLQVLTDGSLSVGDGGITPAKISTGGPGWTNTGQVKLINSKSDISDFWGATSSSNTNGAALFTPYGYFGSNGAYAVSIFSNGYRNASGGFTSLGVNENTKASGIELLPTGDIIFRTGTPSGTSVPEVMRIKSDGEVRVTHNGTTRFRVDPDEAGASYLASNGGANIELYGGSHSGGGARMNIDANDIRFRNQGGSSIYPLTTSSSANMRMNTSSGQLQRFTSSARYKENIQDYDKGIEAIKSLRPVSFQSINEDDDKTYAGFIAEEVHDAELTEFVDYNKEGQPDALHYSNMTAVLTKALQEALVKIENLEAKFAALES